ncbi:hypothetical protein ACUNWD_20505 [Sunxiuqinia sp. A32]|uniref:hypothetical protein n=1 Tax=Sunxiuqinia sp. A32 TaxID=3461496 RepID=UPI004045F092
MKKLLNFNAVLLFLFIANTAGAQKYMVGVGCGYATFDMTDTKDYNETVLSKLPFAPFITDDFPGWYFFQAEALYSFPKVLAVGLKFSTTSTGSRIHLADYSGEYTFDNQQKGWFPGLKLLLGKAPGRKSGISVSIEGGMAFSFMTFDEKILVNEEAIDNYEEFNARGYYLQPGVNYMQHLGEHIIISANISFYKGFENGYYAEGDKDLKIRNNDTGEKIEPNWNGLRAGLVVYWRL